MRLSSLLTIITAAFTSRIIAIPASPNFDNNPINILQAREGDHCYESTFHGETFNGSALITDCQQLADSLDGSLSKEVDKYERPYAIHGTCKFLVYNNIRPYHYIARVGDQDVKDIIRDSISKFGRDGRVGARGTMRCNPGNQYVSWSIRREN
jgi:hypothetical protein